MSNIMKHTWEKIEMSRAMDARLCSQIKNQIGINENQRDENGEKGSKQNKKGISRTMVKVAAAMIPVLLGGSIAIASTLGSIQKTWFVKPISQAVLPEEVQEQQEVEVMDWQDIEEIDYQEGFQKMGIQTYMPTWFEDVGGTVTVKYREIEDRQTKELAVYIRGTQLDGIINPISLMQVFVDEEMPEWGEEGGVLMLNPGDDKKENQERMDRAECIEYTTKGGWKALLQDYHTEYYTNNIYMMGQLSDGRYLSVFMNYDEHLEPEDIYPILDTIPAIE